MSIVGRTIDVLGLAAAGAGVGTPQLTYAMTPETVPVSSTQTLTLTITNPSEKFGVALNPGPTTLVSLQNLSQLTATPGDITASTPPGTPWQAGIVDGSTGKYLKVWVTAAVTLAPQQSVAIQLGDIKVVDLPGAAALAVVEIINGARATAPPLQIGLMAAALQIFAVAKPTTVGLGQQTTLQWTIVQGVYVTVDPPDDGTQYFRSGQGWYTHAIPVLPYQDARQTIYTLTVYQDQSNFRQATVVVNLSQPQIAAFHAETLGPLMTTEAVSVAWVVRYAGQVRLVPSTSAGYVAPEDQRTMTPGNFLPPNASSVTFTLTADGFTGAVQKTLTFQFAPMRIACFRYPDFDTRNAYLIDVFNGLGVVHQDSAPGAFTLTATGPGGPLTQQLGGTGLEVQVLVADSPQIAGGASTTLRYRVQNATGLTLLPDNRPLAFDGQGLGSVVIAPTQTTTYTLRATNSSALIESDITVAVVG